VVRSPSRMSTPQAGRGRPGPDPSTASSIVTSGGVKGHRGFSPATTAEPSAPALPQASQRPRTAPRPVDEFQDLTTPLHLLMIRLLSMPTLDVVGVGDDDQVKPTPVVPAATRRRSRAVVSTAPAPSRDVIRPNLGDTLRVRSGHTGVVIFRGDGGSTHSAGGRWQSSGALGERVWSRGSGSGRNRPSP
jgi:hypothetical protein